MDINLVYVLVAVVLAAVIVAAILRYRQHGSGEIKGPFGMSARFQGSNERPLAPGDALVERAKSAHGGITATNAAAGNATVRSSSAERDITASVGPSSTPAPKAPPSQQ